MIVDCFPFFAPYGEELLKLRVNLLKDVVDKFIIVESNKTHSGKPVERKFLDIALKQGLPMEKIIYIEHDIPETEELVIEKIDKINAGVNKSNEESLYARVRERLQKDAVMQAMGQFNDNDVFIYGDADEIIKPENVRWVARMCVNHQDIILKIPLAYLQGRADLRAFNTDGSHVVWWKAMFFATKAQIMKTSVNRIRCGAMDWPIRWPTHQNKVIQDMGWHFAWMGNAKQRQAKADSFAHAHDSFEWMADGAKGYSEYDKLGDTLMEEGPAPDGNVNHHLKRFPVEQLPKLIFEDEDIKEFLLPSVKMDEDYQFSACNCFWCQKLQFPLLYNLDGERNWFEVPRSCSVTIKETFPDRRQIMRDTDDYDELRGKPIMVFSDPVERFESCINAYLVEKQRYYHYGEDMFASFGVDLKACTKQEKIDYFFANFNKLSSHHQLHHFHPQAWFVDQDKFKKFTVVDKHDVSKTFNVSHKLNQTKKEILRDDLSDEQLAFVKKIYEEDYEFYKKHK
jgi:hypothetical protein